jgi:putative ABC transport system substrate-binding protein
MNNRRKLIVALGAGALGAPFGSFAQQAPKLFRVGVLAGGGSNFDAGFGPFRQRLQELGYVEGRTISLVVRNAEGRAERLAEFAGELVRLPADVIVVQGNNVLAALQQATQTIPIVMATIGDPVGSGFIASLAKPGGNITGLANMADDLSAKWVELLKEVAPKVTRLAVLWDSRVAAHQSMWREIQRASRDLKVAPRVWEARTPEEIERAFAAMDSEAMGALIVLPHPPFIVNRRQISELAIKHRLPAIYLFREFAEAGCLMAYGPSVADLWSRSADYVDKILKGVKPMDLPVAQPTKFEFVINMKTAKALGIKIPNSILVQATTVIE